MSAFNLSSHTSDEVQIAPSLNISSLKRLVHSHLIKSQTFILYRYISTATFLILFSLSIISLATLATHISVTTTSTTLSFVYFIYSASITGRSFISFTLLLFRIKYPRLWSFQQLYARSDQILLHLMRFEYMVGIIIDICIFAYIATDDMWTNELLAAKLIIALWVINSTISACQTIIIVGLCMLFGLEIYVFFPYFPIAVLDYDVDLELQGTRIREGQTVLETLPIYTYSRKIIQAEEINENGITTTNSNTIIRITKFERDNIIYNNDTCAICLNEFHEGESMRKLKCSHYYHQICCDQWLRLRCICPLCLSTITADPSSIVSGEKENINSLLNRPDYVKE